MLNFIKSSLKYFIVGILALIPVVIVIQVLVFLETILRDFFIYIYGYSNNVFKSKMDIRAVTSFIVSVAVDLHQKEELEKLAGLSHTGEQS
jgi:hypothetical protein